MINFNFYWKMKQGKAQDSLILGCALVATSQRGRKWLSQATRTIQSPWPAVGRGWPCDPTMASAVGEICRGHRKDFCPPFPRSGRRCCHRSTRCCRCSRRPPTTMRGQENFRDDPHSGLVGSQKQPWTGSSPFCHPTPPTLGQEAGLTRQLAQLQCHWPVGGAESDQSHE